MTTGWAQPLLARVCFQASRLLPERVALHPNVKEIRPDADHLVLARSVFGSLEPPASSWLPTEKFLDALASNLRSKSDS